MQTFLVLRGRMKYYQGMTKKEGHHPEGEKNERNKKRKTKQSKTTISSHTLKHKTSYCNKTKKVGPYRTRETTTHKTHIWKVIPSQDKMINKKVLR